MDRRERNYRRALAVADMVAAAVSVPLAIGLLGGERLRGSYLILIPLIVLTSRVLGLYDHDELVVKKSTLDELPQLVSLASTFTLLVWGTRHLTVLGAPGTPAMAALWGALAASLTGCRSIARRIAARVSPVERCLVLGDERAYDRLRVPLDHQHGVTLVGCVGLERALVDVAWLPELAAGEQVHRIIIAPDDTLCPEDTLELVRRAKETGLRVSLLPGILEAVGSSVVFDDIGGITLLGVPRFGLTRSSMAVKRAFDVVVTSLLLVAGLPIVAVAALLIRLDSVGPGVLPPDARRQGRPALRDDQAADDDRRRRRTQGEPDARSNETHVALQDRRRPAHHPRRPRGCAALTSTSCRS